MKTKNYTKYIIFRKETTNRYMFLGEYNKLKEAKENAKLNSFEKNDSYILEKTTIVKERKIKV